MNKEYVTRVPVQIIKECDPYELHVWLIVKSITGEEGECTLSTEDLAALCRISVRKIQKVRRTLLDNRYLEGEVRRDFGEQLPTWHLRIPMKYRITSEWREAG